MNAKNIANDVSISTSGNENDKSRDNERQHFNGVSLNKMSLSELLLKYNREAAGIVTVPKVVTSTVSKVKYKSKDRPSSEFRVSINSGSGRLLFTGKSNISTILKKLKSSKCQFSENVLP